MRTKFFLHEEKVREEEFYQVFGKGFIKGGCGPGDQDDFPGQSSIQLSELRQVSSMALEAELRYDGQPPVNLDQFQMVVEISGNTFRAPFEMKGGKAIATWIMGGFRDWGYDPRAGQAGKANVYISGHPLRIESEQVLGVGWFDDHIHANMLFEFFPDGSQPPPPPAENHTLTTHVIGEGIVEPASGTYNHGTEIALIAQAAANWRFVEWQGDLSGTENPITLVMDDNKDISAIFAESGGDLEEVIRLVENAQSVLLDAVWDLAVALEILRG